MNKFKVGDRVKIIPDTRYYEGNEYSSNPKNISGIISGVHGEDDERDYHVYSVNWDNKNSNSYTANDLVLIEFNMFPIY